MLLTIDSAGQVLSLFTNEHPERGVTEVAVALQVSKSKAHALLSSLTTVGLLRRTERGRYRVGWRVLSLNRVLAETTDFRLHARQVMQTLGGRYGELVHLAALDDGQVVYVDRIRGTRAVQIDDSSLGARLPAHVSAVGKALLASLSREHRDELFTRHGLEPRTARSITDRDVLEAELEQVRVRGYASEHGEAIDDVSCVAAPIVAPGPITVAAISISAPSYRFQERKAVYSQAVVRAGLYVSQRLAEIEATPPTAVEPVAVPV
jgi:DNA-binding IclR family transcriptional regulator